MQSSLHVLRKYIIYKSSFYIYFSINTYEYTHPVKWQNVETLGNNITQFAFNIHIHSTCIGSIPKRE